jgi:hypothetical protein
VPKRNVSISATWDTAVRLCGSAFVDRQGKEMKCKRTQLPRAPPMDCCPLTYRNTAGITEVHRRTGPSVCRRDREPV